MRAAGKAKLRKWLKDNNHKTTPWAQSIKVPAPALSRIFNGKQASMHIKNIKKIIEATDGHMEFSDFY